ncbi:MAG: tetratricopeptide repeat protein [Bryobacterales bacterium]|nr:tetratricopeptide repeat protein [Bryobacterales bacterium]
MSDSPRSLFLFAALLSGAVVLQAQGVDPAQKAHQEFEKVFLSQAPPAADTAACVQAHNALLAMGQNPYRHIFNYRKGFCHLAAALESNQAELFRNAARDFAKAVADWPPEDLANAQPLQVLSVIARLEHGRRAAGLPASGKELAAAIEGHACTLSAAMDAATCEQVMAAGRMWLGWLAFRANDLDEAARWLAPLGETAWSEWVASRLRRRAGNPADAIPHLEKAIETWERDGAGDLTARLSPPPDLAEFALETGLAQQGAGRHAEAIRSFAIAERSDPRNSTVLLYRAGSRESLGQDAEALSDYAKAIQIARSLGSAGWPLGSAHFRRGTLLYRARDFAAAQREFTDALESELGDVPRGDVTAWRTMAGVAAGGCQASAGVLETLLPQTSPAFPRQEAERHLFDCRFGRAETLEALLGLESDYQGRLDEQRSSALGARLAQAFAEAGVAAEDAGQPDVAAERYKAAIERDPSLTKARFNLGGILFERELYSAAEAQYQAVVRQSPGDLEARYWLAESMLAQDPTPERRVEACAHFRESLAVANPDLRRQYTEAFATSGCPK